MLKTTDDILEAWDRDTTALVLLDFTKAFDHKLLKAKLKYLNFSEFLNNRCQYVTLKNENSKTLLLSKALHRDLFEGVCCTFYTLLICKSW
nr:unnamed protein product [Callosobruchus analis]